MRDLYLQAVGVMENAFRRLEGGCPPPQWVSQGEGHVFRHVEQQIEQALVQKLARYISGLHAIDALLLNGFVQEQGVIQRTLDEIGDDILFLVLAVTTGEVTPLHQRYLVDFWAEEFDGPTPLQSSQKRGMVKRKNIHAYLSRAQGMDDPSTSDALQRTLHKAYSGYVHAASPHIMEMVGGMPPVFHLSGMQGTPRIEEHARDAENYVYRGLLAALGVANAFGDRALADALYNYRSRYEKMSGRDFSGGVFKHTH